VTGRRVGVLLCAPLLGACWHTDVRRTWPGHVDVRTPPDKVVVDAVDGIKDPGEQYLVFSPGVFGGGGVAIDSSGAARAAASLGAEASVHYGTRHSSHAEDDFLFYPERAYGLNAGWTLVNQDRAGPSVGYLEAQFFDELYGVAAGWAWDPTRAQSGPQATLFAGPLYARVLHIAGDGTDVTFGLFVKVPYSWVWAR